MRPKVKIVRDPILIDGVIGSVESPSAGCIVSFIGTVRNKSGLGMVTEMHLEAAEDLARKDIRRIAERAMSTHELIGVAVTHRVGDLKVGEVIVVVAVSAAHRKDAFDACEYMIDELKKTTPIWKKELSGRRGQWVKGES